MWLKSPKISPLGNSTGVKHLKIKNGPLQKMDIKIFYEFCKILKGREARKGNQNFLSNVQLRLLPKLWPFLSTTPCWWLTTGHCRAETMSSGLPSSRNCAPHLPFGRCSISSCLISLDPWFWWPLTRKSRSLRGEPISKQVFSSFRDTSLIFGSETRECSR